MLAIHLIDSVRDQFYLKDPIPLTMFHLATIFCNNQTPCLLAQNVLEYNAIDNLFLLNKKLHSQYRDDYALLVCQI